MEDSRKKELIFELGKHNVNFRDDSELCKKYICGSETDINYVVNTMVEMEFYFKETMYRQIYKKDKSEAKHINSNWDDDKEESLRTRAKEKAFKNYHFRHKNNKEKMDMVPLTIKNKFLNL